MDRILSFQSALLLLLCVHIFRERGLLRPWNPHRESITDVPGSKSRDLKIMNEESTAGGGRGKKRKRAVKKVA